MSNQCHNFKPCFNQRIYIYQKHTQMKKKLLLLPFILILGYVGLTSYSGGPGTSGLNLTTSGCGGGGCHTASTTTTVTIELDSAGISVPRYVAGQSYTIKIVGTNTGGLNLPGFGFQLTAENTAGSAMAGTLATAGLPASTHNVTVGAFHIFEHTAALAATTGGGATGSTYVQSIQWTAPATGFGTVKLVGVLNAVNLDGVTSGDQYKIANAVNLTEIVAPITGPSLSLCVGAQITLSDATTGGTWSNGGSSVASVNSAGVVTGLQPGTAVISYNAGSLGTATATVTVNALPNAGTITGSDSVCMGATISLADVTGVGTGTWSTTTPGITSVNPVTGIVGGVGPGVGSIKYTVVNSCGSVFTTHSVTVNPLPSAGVISGAGSVCAGASISLSDGASSGTWGVNFPSIATVNSSGVVTGLSGGTSVISYTVTTSCGIANALHTVNVNPTPTAGTISGTPTICQGTAFTFTDAGASGGGVWSSSATSVATVGFSNGIVHAVAGGLDTIRYTVVNSCGSDTAKYPVSVLLAPNAGTVSGHGTVCVGSFDTLVDAGSVGTGTWNTSAPGTATIDANGIITGLSAGTALISYSVVNTCGSLSTTPFTVQVQNPVTAGPISGSPSVCAGANTSLAGTSLGGVWISGTPTIATINGSGMVHGVAAGISTITYAVSNSCGVDTAYFPITVNPLPIAGTLSGANTVCMGAITSLTPTVGGGSWSSTVTTVATVASGNVTGVLAGNTIISYTVSNGCGNAAATHPMTVNPLPVGGNITGSATVCVGATLTFGETSGGGSWSVNPTTLATIVSGTGAITGVQAGNVIVTYTVNNSCGTATANRTMTVNPLPVTGTISGTSVFCAGTSVTLSETSSGGGWSSGSPGIATVDPLSGMVTGLSGGTAVISYGVSNTCGTLYATYTVNITPATTAGTITGSSLPCIGLPNTLSDAIGSGTWSVNPATVATIDPNGVVYGVSIGTATATYTVMDGCGTASAFYTLSVGNSATIAPITGANAVCEASLLTLSDISGGGSWSSSNPAVATVDASGVVSGVSGGVTIISYSVITGCGTGLDTQSVTVTPLPNAGFISGASTLCQSGSVSLSETVTGGVWSSSPSTVATVNASGVVTGLSGGVVVIAYTSTTGCGTNLAAHTMTISPLPAIGTITGLSSECQGTSVTLTSSVTGGVWHASNATANVSVNGVVTGVSFGIDTIYYNRTNACGTSGASFIDTIYPTSLVGGISGADTVCQGDTIHLSVLILGGAWTTTNTNAFTTPTGDIVGVTPGSDTIVYTITNMCGTYSASLHMVVRSSAACAAGVPDLQGRLSGISVYPNPASGIFTVEIPETNEQAIITIYDVVGKAVETRAVDSSNGSKTTFNLSSVAPGSYIIKVQAGDKNYREKIVIR